MLVNTIEFSEVPRYGLTKAPKGSYEYREWWKEQYNRCLNGYTIGDIRITGYHYWYLNFWLIRGINTVLHPEQKQKRLISPRFLELDWKFFNEWERCKKENKNFIVFKKRQCGASEKVSAIAGYEFSLFPASQTIILAGEEKYARNTMNFCKRGLNALVGTEFHVARNPDTIMESVARRKVFDKDGSEKWVGIMSELHMLTAKNNPEVASRFSPSLSIFEECGRFKLALDTYGYVAPSQESEGKKTGWSIFLMTSTDLEEGIEVVSKLVFNPSDYDAMEYENTFTPDTDNKKTCYFIPGWSFLKIDEDGNDLVEESIQECLNRRSEAEKSKNPKKLVEEVIARPLNPEEALMIFKGSRFNAMKLNAQRALILRKKELEYMPIRCDLEWVYDKIAIPGSPKGSILSVKRVNNEKGDFIILDPPKMDSKGKPLPYYFAGTDSYDKDEALSSNSMGSCSIFNGMLKMYCARITARPLTAEEFYEQSAKLAYYYDAPNLIEWSNVGIFGWYKRKNLLGLLKERPRIAYANVKRSMVNNKWGVDPTTKEMWISSYRDYIEDHSEKMFDLVQINRALEYHDDKNCDITISCSLAYVNYLDSVEHIVEPETKEEKIEFFHYQIKAGRMIQQFYTNERKPDAFDRAGHTLQREGQRVDQA